MSGEEDDKPTVVLDLDALKKELKQKENELSDIASDISFGTEEDELSTLDEETQPKSETPVILFDFNSTFFSENEDDFPSGHNFQIVKELKELNTIMQQRKPAIVVFNYSAYAKACTQLTLQIKEKFPLIRIILAAKNLSKEKAEKHKATRAGAHGYLTIPIQKENFASLIEELDQQ